MGRDRREDEVGFTVLVPVLAPVPPERHGTLLTKSVILVLHLLKEFEF